LDLRARRNSKLERHARAMLVRSSFGRNGLEGRHLGVVLIDVVEHQTAERLRDGHPFGPAPRIGLPRERGMQSFDLARHGRRLWHRPHGAASAIEVCKSLGVGRADRAVPRRAAETQRSVHTVDLPNLAHYFIRALSSARAADRPFLACLSPSLSLAYPSSLCAMMRSSYASNRAFTLPRLQ